METNQVEQTNLNKQLTEEGEGTEDTQEELQDDLGKLLPLICIPPQW